MMSGRAAGVIRISYHHCVTRMPYIPYAAPRDRRHRGQPLVSTDITANNAGVRLGDDSIPLNEIATCSSKQTN